MNKALVTRSIFIKTSARSAQPWRKLETYDSARAGPSSLRSALAWTAVRTSIIQPGWQPSGQPRAPSPPARRRCVITKARCSSCAPGALPADARFLAGAAGRDADGGRVLQRGRPRGRTATNRCGVRGGASDPSRGTSRAAGQTGDVAGESHLLAHLFPRAPGLRQFRRAEDTLYTRDPHAWSNPRAG